MTGQGAGELPYDVLPQDRLRRVTARRLRAAVPDKPQVTLHARARVDAILDARRALDNDPLPDSGRVTVTAALARVVTEALIRTRRLNGHVDRDEVRLFRAVNLGVAVDAGRGLVVPVIRDAQAKNVREIARELDHLAVKARAGDLHPSDLTDATFTMSNLGMYGVELFTPLVNPPQMAILGVGATVPTPAMVNGDLTEVRLVGLSLSFDHAAMDGAEAATFLRGLTELIENPAELLALDTTLEGRQ